jgi:hypothetical protein
MIGQEEGRHYEALLAAAETLEPDHPLAATILYRALLDDILNRARSPAYGIFAFWGFFNRNTATSVVFV